MKPFILLMLILSDVKSAGSGTDPANSRSFAAKGTVMEVKPGWTHIAVIRHEAISNYMAAMTMPFKVKAPEELAGLRRGDEISFQLRVTESESWVEHITKIGTVPLPPLPTPVQTPGRPAEPSIAGLQIHQ